MDSKSKTSKYIIRLNITIFSEHVFFFRFYRHYRNGRPHQTAGTSSVPGDKRAHDGNAHTEAKSAQTDHRFKAQEEVVPKRNSADGNLRAAGGYHSISTGCSAASTLVRLHGPVLGKGKASGCHGKSIQPVHVGYSACYPN